MILGAESVYEEPSPEQGTGSRTIRLPVLLALAAITALAFILRVLGWRVVFHDGLVRFLDGDAFYHMRRILLALDQDLRIPPLDMWIGFPAGVHCHWPPLFDQLVAWTVRMSGGASEHAAEVAGAFVAPVLGSLVVPVVYGISRYWLSRPASLLASAIFTVSPYAVQVSVLGRPDHHPAVLLASGLLLFFASGFAVRIGHAGGRRHAAAAGFCLGTCLALWPGGSLMFVVILVGTSLGILLVSASDAGRLRIARHGACLLFLVAAALLLPFASTSYWTRSGNMAWGVLGTFHVVALLGCAALVQAVGLGLAAWRQYRNRNTNRSLPMGWTITAGAGLLVIVLAAAYGLRGSFEWLFKVDPLLVHIVENLPLTVSSAVEDFTGLVVLYPFVLGWLVVVHGRTRPALGILLAGWAIGTGFNTLVQERFADLFSVPASLLWAAFPALVWDRFRKLAKPGLNGWIPITLAILLCGASLLPTAKWLRFYWRSTRAPHPALDALYELGTWIRQNTPTAGDPMVPSVRPAYGVLAHWDLGNALMFIGRRPVVACNLGGFEENREANLAPYRFFTETNAVAARHLLDGYGVRYIVVDETLESGRFARMLTILGLPHERFFESRNVDDGPVFVPRRSFLDSMACQLYIEDGDRIPCFRKVFESSQRIVVAGKARGLYKVFEYGGP